MRIINLKSNNLKGIKAIDITPKSNVVIISGKNGAGKTSALDSIWYAMEWKAGVKGTPMPIRKGEETADVKLTLCEDKTKKPLFIVYRSWTPKNSYLKVTNADGLVYETPQKLLDGFIGYLSFDPRVFAKMKSPDQRQLLLKLVDVDLDTLDAEIDKLKEERRLQGQTVKLYEGERDTRDFSETPTEEIDVRTLQSKVERAIDHNRDIDDAEHKMEYSREQIRKNESSIVELEGMIINLKKGISTYKDMIDSDQKFIGDNEKIDVEIVRGLVNAALEINEFVQAKNRNIQSDLKRNEAQKIYDNFTTKIEQKLRSKVLTLEHAKMPIKGLSVNNTGVIYNDIPFSQLSFSEQLIIAVKIGMALNAKLRVIRISDYSLLDDDTKKRIEKMAEKEDYQIWAETVDGSGTVGFYIEEGEVKND